MPFPALVAGAIGGLAKFVGPSILVQGLQASGGPFDTSDRSPKLDLARVFRETREIEERGLTPRVSVDPFTGNVVISTADQSGVLFEILESKFLRESLAPTAEELASDLAFRDFIIEQRRLTSRPLSALTQVSSIPSSTRPTARLIGPGVVGRGNAPRPVIPTLVSRLSGPCAGPQTGFSRLTCARGGIA